MKRTILFASLLLCLAATACSKNKNGSASGTCRFIWQAVGTSVDAYGCWVNIHGECLPTPSEALEALKILDDDRPGTCHKPMPLHIFVRVPNARSPSLSVQNFPDDGGPKIFFSGVSVPTPSEADAWETTFCNEQGVTCLTRGMHTEDVYRYGNYKSADLDPMTPRPTIHGGI
jgi:hypothetical protein